MHKIITNGALLEMGRVINIIRYKVIILNHMYSFTDNIFIQQIIQQGSSKMLILYSVYDNSKTTSYAVFPSMSYK